MSSFLRDRVSPVVVFPTLIAVAFRLLIVPLVQADVNFGDSCKPAQNITNIPVVDEILCPFVAFFAHLMHDPDGEAFLTYAFGISLPLVMLPMVEAYRPGQSKLLRYPMGWLMISQIITVGVTMPAYWLTFLLTSGPKKVRQGSTASYRDSDVLALVFSLIIGAVVPTVGMMILDDSAVTALWQFYPVFVAVAQFLHRQLRPESQHSAFTTLQFLFFGVFLVSSSVHISTVWPMWNDSEGLKTLLIPSISLPSSTAPATYFLNFLKWDVSMAFVSTIAASFWLAHNIKQAILMALWYAFSIPAFGFGASVMGVAVWANGLL